LYIQFLIILFLIAFLLQKKNKIRRYRPLVFKHIWLIPDEKEALVAVSSLPEWCGCCFPKLKQLNRIQSEVFKSAFKSNENMLVCAPTGAGKTAIAGQ
jgi:superfamily II DNA or RNA helicase